MSAAKLATAAPKPVIPKLTLQAINTAIGKREALRGEVGYLRGVDRQAATVEFKDAARDVGNTVSWRRFRTENPDTAAEIHQLLLDDAEIQLEAIEAELAELGYVEDEPPQDVNGKDTAPKAEPALKLESKA